MRNKASSNCSKKLCCSYHKQNKYNSLLSCFDRDLTLVSEQGLTMLTNKEWIECVEVELGGMQNNIQRIEQGMNDKFHHLEAMISKLVESFSLSQGVMNQQDQAGSLRPGRGESEGERQQFPPQVAKLEFPRYSGGDPTEWFNRVTQFFDYQQTADDQRVVYLIIFLVISIIAARKCFFSIKRYITFSSNFRNHVGRFLINLVYFDFDSKRNYLTAKIQNAGKHFVYLII
ncbi:hypothetical protein WN944_029473 [Citrus x changshan-huyou]|uniref:Uncharacterized protein n=1 Tax=Citrus x changshan-huyou TaxID=2935761 RepID=A0AAP0LLU6_9ROSI